jgi:hypothetical protein
MVRIALPAAARDFRFASTRWRTRGRPAFAEIGLFRMFAVLLGRTGAAEALGVGMFVRHVNDPVGSPDLSYSA